MKPVPWRTIAFAKKMPPMAFWIGLVLGFFSWGALFNIMSSEDEWHLVNNKYIGSTYGRYPSLIACESGQNYLASQQSKFVEADQAEEMKIQETYFGDDRSYTLQTAQDTIRLDTQLYDGISTGFCIQF